VLVQKLILKEVTENKAQELESKAQELENQAASLIDKRI
jgi:hypothetical protein